MSLKGTRRPIWKTLARALFGRGDRWSRLLALQRDLRYWTFRSWWKRTTFATKRRTFLLGQALKGSREASSLVAQLMRGVAWRMLRSGGLVAILGLAEAYVTATYPGLRDTVPFSTTPEAASVVLLTVAQIVGVFLGLYFAALSAVVSSLYGDAPSDVRNMLIREKAGNVFIELLAFAGGGSVFLLGGTAFGLNPGTANVGLVVLAAGVAIFGFVLLGKRAFEFFEPAALLGHVHARFDEAAVGATSKGYAYDEPSFQSNYQHVAEEALTGLDHLADFCAGRKHYSSDSLKDIAVYSLRSLAVYSLSKNDIPTDSYWFRREYRHPSWLRAGGSEVEIALQTSSGLHPSSVADRYWVEDFVVRILTKAIRALVANDDYALVTSIAERGHRVLRRLTAAFHIKVATQLQLSLNHLAEDVAKKNRGKEPALIETLALKALAAEDALRSGVLELVIGTGLTAKDLGVHDVRDLGALAARQKPGEPLGREIPYEVRREYDALVRSLAFERDVEGQAVTPRWFSDHVMAAGFVAFYARWLPQLVDAVKDTYLKPAKEDSTAEAVFGRLTIMQRGLEACDKLSAHGKWVAESFARISALRWLHASPEKPWPELDWAKVNREIAELRRGIVDCIAAFAPRMPSNVPTGKIPDELGFAFTSLGQESFAARLDGEAEAFVAVFPAFLTLSFRMFDRAREELKEYSIETQFGVRTDVLIDLLEISGYALVLDELDGLQTFPRVKEAWDLFLSSHRDPKWVVQLIVQSVSLRRGMFQVSSRDVLRTRRTMEFEGAMRDKGLLSDSYFHYARSGVSAEPISAIARAAIGGMGVAPSDVFLSEYLLRRSEAKSLEAPRAVEEFRRRLDREDARVNDE